MMKNIPFVWVFLLCAVLRCSASTLLAVYMDTNTAADYLVAMNPYSGNQVIFLY